MIPALPDPRALALPPLQPAARRNVRVHGVEVELVLLPERARRPGGAVPGRPPFQRSAAERILDGETLWQDDTLAATPNRFPFATNQLIVWSRQPTREHDAAMLAALSAWADAHAGTALLNTVGAAASIARAHAHLTTERLPFLATLRERPLAAGWLPAVDGATFVQKDVPFLLVGARGAVPARAAAIQALQLCRMTPAANVVAQDGAAWLYPRSVHETPAPHFPYALGAAELWGRWCYVEPEPFERATGPQLEQALLRAGCPA